MKKSSSVIGRYTGKCCDSNVFNNNDMKLNRELFEKLLSSDKYKRAMKYRHYIGFLGHPDDPGCMDYRNACIVMTDCKITDSGEIEGTFDLIGTPVGIVVKSFIDAGVEFGLSIRGAGDVDPEGNVDPDTFEFRGFDLVTFPAYDDCIPSFQEIAAGSDINKQVKMNSIRKAVRENLSKITSSEALDVLKHQFREGSDEYNQVSARMSNLAISASSDDINIDSEKVKGVTKLYVEACIRISELEQEIADTRIAKQQEAVKASNKLKSFRSKASKQYDSISTRAKDVESENRKLKSQVTRLNGEVQEAVSANTKLKSDMARLRSENLKYVHKIESSSKLVASKNSKIAELESRVSKTVADNNTIKEASSNRDEEIRNLKASIQASESIIAEYQQAYADMYASALGVRITNISVTASTSVSELKQQICRKSYSNSALTTIECSDQIDDIEVVADDNGIITI